MSQAANKKRQVFLKKIMFSSQIENKENQVDHLMTETPLVEEEKDESHITEHLKSPTLAQDSSKQEYYKIIDKSQSQSSELVSKKSYGSSGYVFQQLKKTRKKKASFSLKNVLLSMRVKEMNFNFVTKLKLNNIYSTPISETDIWNIQNSEQEQQNQTKYNSLLTILKACYIIAILGVFFSLSFSMAFEQLRSSSLIDFFVILGIIVTLIQLMKNLLQMMSILKQNRMRSLQAKPLILLQTTTQFIILLNLIFYFSDYHFPYKQIASLFCLAKIHKLSSYFHLVSGQYNQYFELSKIYRFVKLLLSNLFFAHVIAIILNIMISDRGSNWQVDQLIQDRQWTQKYIWSYYWAVISIGKIGVQFTPKNSVQAAWIIVIQLICFAVLLYNMSQIAVLLGLRKGPTGNPSRRANLLLKMISDNDLSSSLESKIRQILRPDYLQYCEQSNEQNEILNTLPLELQEQISSEKNYPLLCRTLSFFLQYPTLKQIAAKMKKRKYCPSQIIRHYTDPHHIYILQNGTVSYVSRQRGWAKQMEGNVVTSDRDALLLNWDFITYENMTFNIKAKSASTVGKIDFEDFLSSLKLRSHDFEYYCFLRDKSKNILGQFEMVYCKFCRKMHTAFTCHKMHYIPLKQNIIYRYFTYLKRPQLNPRMSIERVSMRKSDTLRSHGINRYHYNNRLSYGANTNYNQFARQQPYFYQCKQGECYSKDLSTMLKRLNESVFPFFDKYEDNMWGIATDACHNYRNYFPKSNIINLPKNIFSKPRVK